MESSAKKRKRRGDGVLSGKQQTRIRASERKKDLCCPVGHVLFDLFFHDAYDRAEPLRLECADGKTVETRTLWPFRNEESSPIALAYATCQGSDDMPTIATGRFDSGIIKAMVCTLVSGGIESSCVLSSLRNDAENIYTSGTFWKLSRYTIGVLCALNFLCLTNIEERFVKELSERCHSLGKLSYMPHMTPELLSMLRAYAHWRRPHDDFYRAMVDVLSHKMDSMRSVITDDQRACLEESGALAHIALGKVE